MLQVILSPAKAMEWTRALPTQQATQPLFLEEANQLAQILQQCSAADLAKLMSLSSGLAELNQTRYANWKYSDLFAPVARPAVFAFNGPVYTSLMAYEWNEQQIETAQACLRILSGLYGILRPLDLIQPYRLEMGTRLENAVGRDLYAFWGLKINRHLQLNPKASVINLASQEYAKAMRLDCFSGRVVNVRFEDWSRDRFQMVGVLAKKARGAMAHYIIKECLQHPEDIQTFSALGYSYQPQLSQPNVFIFRRKQA